MLTGESYVGIGTTGYIDMATLDSNDFAHHLQVTSDSNGVVHISSGNSDRLSLDANSVLIDYFSAAGVVTNDQYGALSTNADVFKEIPSQADYFFGPSGNLYMSGSQCSPR